jgi:hypothetical protein
MLQQPQPYVNAILITALIFPIPDRLAEQGVECGPDGATGWARIFIRRP